MISVNCHSSIKIFKNNITIYVDPFHIKEPLHDADYILITHDHYDHYSIEDIEKVRNDNTKILILKTHESYEDTNVSIETVPAYNVNKAYHPKEKNYVGYLITLDKEVYYVMGDTDKEFFFNFYIDYLLIPIGGTYTFDASEAANYVNKLRPKHVIPTHYGEIVGSKDDFYTFKERVSKDIDVIKKI